MGFLAPILWPLGIGLLLAVPVFVAVFAAVFILGAPFVMASGIMRGYRQEDQKIRTRRAAHPPTPARGAKS